MPADPFLVAYLAQQDILCPGCKYNLRGLQTDQCPECGESIALHVGLAEPKLGAFIAGLIGLCLGLGFHGFLLVWIMYLAAAAQFTMWDDTPPIFIGLVGTSVGMVFWLKKRSRVRRLQQGTRVLIVISFWLFTFATVLMFFSIAR